MRSPLEQSGDCREDWRRINEVDSDVSGLVFGENSIRALVADARRLFGISGHGMHPFKLYQYPWRLRSSDTEDDWRKLTVRSGKVIAGSALGFSVTGTDGAAYPDDDSLPGAGEFTAPVDTAAYYIWVEVAYASSAWSANIRHAAAPATSGASNPNPWTNWPTMDGHRYLIGIVDTNTNKATKQALVRQLIRADILMGPIFNVCVNGTEKPYAIPGLAQGIL